MAWVPFAIMAGGSALASAVTQHSANQANVEIANSANRLSLELANTAHQREVKDLEAAGLNPMLSYRGSGAPVPQIARPEIQSVGRGTDAAINTGMAGYMQSKTREAIQAEIDLKKATAENIQTDSRLKRVQMIAGLSSAGQADAAAEAARQGVQESKARIENIHSEIKARGYQNALNDAIARGHGLDNFIKIKSYNEIMMNVRNGALLKQYEATEAALGAKAAQASWRVWLAEQGLTLTQIEKIMGALPNVAFVYPMKAITNTTINAGKK